MTDFDESLCRSARVMDAGVGAGRYADADIALKHGAREVVGIDLSCAIENAWVNLHANDCFEVAQASIFSPPFRHETLDRFIANIQPMLDRIMSTRIGHAALRWLPRSDFRNRNGEY